MKISTKVILLRNLNLPKLFNGTRLRITALQTNLIETEIKARSAKRVSNQ